MDAGRLATRLEADLRAERRAHLPLARNVSVLVYVVYAGAYWSPARAASIATWLGLQLVVLLFGLGVTWAGRRRHFSQASAPWMGRLPVLASGIAWAAGYPLMLEDALAVETVAYLMCVAGLVAGATAAYALDPWSGLAFTAPASLPLIWFAIRHMPLMAPAPVLFVACMVWIARGSRAMSLRNHRLRHENQALLEVAETRRAEAEAADASKARFLAAASHDLRQPVQAISLFTHALQQPGHDTAQRAHLLSRLDHAAGRLSAMLEGMLDLSRLDSAKLSLHPRRHDSGALLADIAEAVQADAVEHDVLVQVRGRAVPVWGDPLALRRVLQNLATNAIKYGKPGGMVLLAARGRPGGCELQVWDDGRGIAPAQQEAVFGEFVQLDNPEGDHRKGLGLGLAMVRRLCVRCGWEVRLRSRPGHGSVFSVHVPSQAPPGTEADVAEQPAGHAPADSQHPPPSAAPGLLVWLVEDDADVREAMTVTLRGFGCTVRAYESGDALLATLDGPGTAPDWPGFIVSDARLPGRTPGRSLIASVRQRAGRDIPALIATGDSQAPPGGEAPSPTVAWVTKPVSAAVLARHLHAASADSAAPTAS